MGTQGWIDPGKYKYDCPGERQVQVEFNMTPQDYSLAGLWDDVPAYLFFSFAFSFLGICLGIGIFKCAPSPNPGSATEGREASRCKQISGRCVVE